MPKTGEIRPRARVTRAGENRTERQAADVPETGVHVRGWVRPDTLRPATWERTRRRLASLEATGRIESYTVREWDRNRPPNERDRTGRPLAHGDVLDAFQDWAEREGVTLLPGLQTRDATAGQSADDWTEFVPPVLCLGVCHAGTIDAVFPHIDGGRVETVTDGLAGLRNRDA